MSGGDAAAPGAGERAARLPTPPVTRIALPGGRADAAAGARIEPLLTAGAEPERELRAQLTAARQWEVELGFGKGRYLLRRAEAERERRFLGIEMVGEYFRLAARRAQRRGLDNLVLLQGEALYLLAAVLPRGFASVVHAYFPDPWPKARHHRRRLYDRETLDLVLGLLRPGGAIFFASDHPEYGPAVADLLTSRPELEAARRRELWDDGPRTNYEAKYVAEGRPIVRVEGRLIAAVGEPCRSVIVAPAAAAA